MDQNKPQNLQNAQRPNPVRRCDACEGTLPRCAPLAVPFVPFQQEGDERYNRADALAQGTLFPGLNLPFRLAIKGEPVERTPLSELQALGFVLTDLGLYLDTHPDDQEAFQLFQRYAALEKEGRQRYEEQYGPLQQNSAALDNEYTWIRDPWPWNYKEGR